MLSKMMVLSFQANLTKIKSICYSKNNGSEVTNVSTKTLKTD